MREVLPLYSLRLLRAHTNMFPAAGAQERPQGIGAELTEIRKALILSQNERLVRSGLNDKLSRKEISTYEPQPCVSHCCCAMTPIADS